MTFPFNFNDRVAAVAIPTVIDELPTGRVVLIGWGLIEERQQPRDLKKADKVIEVNSICQTNLERFGQEPPFDQKSNICTSGGTRPEEPLTACSGDSGGPLVDYKSGKPVQVGVVSWGPGPCGTPYAPSVYAKVSHYLTWVKNNL